MPYTRTDIRGWIKQATLPIRVVMVGYTTSNVAAIVGELGCPMVRITPGDPNWLSKAFSEAARSAPHHIFLLLPSMRPPHRENLQSAVIKSVLIDAREEPTEPDVLRWLSSALGRAQMRPSTRTPDKKSNISDIPHHRPDGYEGVTSALCALPSVDLVRYRKAAGEELSAAVVGSNIHASFRIPFGLNISPTCSHPEHIVHTLDAVLGVLNGYR